MKFNLNPIKYFILTYALLIISTVSCTQDTDLLAQVLEPNAEENVEETDPVPDEEPTDVEVNTDIKAFPEAYGGGSKSIGGRGGVLVIINSLDPYADLVYDEVSNTYSGGIKEALALNKPKYIIFNVSGNIDLKNSDAASGRNNITIFGQSAPQGGITFTNGRVRFVRANNLIIRHLRSRPRLGVGDPIPDDASTSAFLFYAGHDIILDHCSASWASDKAINFFSGDDHLSDRSDSFTIQRTLTADSHTGIYMGVSYSGNQSNADNMSIINNLIGRGTNRTPSINGNNYGEVQNNIIHQWSSKLTIVSGNMNLNHINNYYLQASNDVYQDNLFQELKNNNPKIYSNGNFYSKVLSGKSDEDNKVIWKFYANRDKQLPDNFFTTTKHNNIPNPAPILTAEETLGNITKDVGANLYIDDNGEPQFYQDSYDKEVINDVILNRSSEVLKSANWILPAIPTNTRPANYDVDKDGMADAWEIREFGNLRQGYNDDFDGDGYKNIEEFYNQLPK